MSKKVSVQLFKFNAKVDYLPYYKEYEIQYDETDTILDLLNKINVVEKFDYVASDEFNLSINNLFLNVTQKVSTIVDLTSNELTIEPVSVYRATNDLIITKDDFIQKIDAFSAFITPQEMDEYAKNYELDYYASNSYNFNKDYIGDSSLLIASDIIEKTPENKKKILAFISHDEDGIWYHTSLENRVVGYDMQKETKIQNLLEMIPKIQNAKIDTLVTETDKTPNITQFFDGFNIASFEGLTKNSCSSLIKDSKASYVELALKNEDLAPYSTLVNKNFSHHIAGDILLQAKDSNADFLVVRDSSDVELFDAQQSSIAKVMGRDIDMPVISQEQFIQLLDGEKDKTVLGFDKHKIDVSFL